MAHRRKAMNAPSASEGIWYYLWLEPDWFFIPSIESGNSHWAWWNDSIADEIAQHYDLDKKELRTLKTLQHSLPRGRIVEDKPGHFVVAHGNDFPRSLSPRSEINTIIGAFGLSKPHLLGNVEVRFEAHETMDSKHREQLEELIGAVPY